MNVIIVSGAVRGISDGEGKTLYLKPCDWNSE